MHFQILDRIVDRFTWLFFPGKSKQANKDYYALQRDEVGEETGLLAIIMPAISKNQLNLMYSRRDEQIFVDFADRASSK